jgi:hypothetical protein
MNRIHLKTNVMTATCLSLIMVTSSYAASYADNNVTSKAMSKSVHTSSSNKTQVEVESDQGQGSSPEEIATVDVLKEICPEIIGTNNNKNFSKGYNILIKHMLPSIKDPVAAVQAMHTDPDYMKIYDNARVSALKEKVEDNREVCLEVLHYKAP